MKNSLKKLIIFILTVEAGYLLKRKNPKIIAVTGSVGKTSTKDAIYTILKNHYPTRKNEKSFNSEIGVPLTVLGLPNAWNSTWGWFKNIVDGFFIAAFSKEYPEYLIVEAGIDRPGDMTNLTKWLKPDIVVLTRLPDVPVHVEYFATPEAVTAEKMKLVEALKPEGVLVFNADDKIIQAQLETVRSKRVGFSRYLVSDFTAREDKVFYRDDEPVGTAFVLASAEQKQEFKIGGVLGPQQVYIYAAAATVAAECGVDLSKSALALSTHTPPPGRMRIFKGIKGTFIIDDTYNSSPAATEQALAALREIKYRKRKIAVLGDMLELGKFSQAEHERIGELVPKVADVLVTIGVRARKIAEAALAAGLSEQSILQYEDSLKAGKELQNFIQSGDLILVKASQSIRAEKTVEEIMLEPERAVEFLVRQDRAWEKR